MPKLAANLSLLFNEYDFPDRFAAAARAGFRGVECQFPYAWPAAELAGRLAENGLVQVLINAPPGDLAAGDRGVAALPGREAEFADGFALALDYAGALECSRIHVLAGVAAADSRRGAMRDTFVRNLRTAAEAAARQGVTVLIEPINLRDMPGYFLSRSHEARGIIEEVGAANLRLQYDFYHMQIMEGDLLRTVAANLDIIGHFQIAGVPDRREPDAGEVNYPVLFAALDEMGYEGWIGCEYHPAGRTEDGLRWAAPYGIAPLAAP